MTIIGRFAEQVATKVLVAASSEGELVGGVVYFGDMAEDLDFSQQGLPVFGFWLNLRP